MESVKLIYEDIDFNDLEIITEETKEKKKVYKIKGPYIRSEIKNKNGRTYGKMIVEREVSKLNKEKIEENRCWGNLDHPPSPVVSLKDASHIIRELKMYDKDAVGVSEILDTPMGRIASTCIEAGQIMLSSRGLGKVLPDGMVKENWNLITIDIVSDGSTPGSYGKLVEGILENTEFIIGDDGEIVETAIENLQKKVDDNYSDSFLKCLYFQEFLKEVRKNIK